MKLSHLMIVILSLVLVARAELAGAQAVAEKKEAAPVPVPMKEGKVELTPKNSTVQFIGTHIGPEPNPRICYFTKFKGVLTIEAATKAPQSAELDIESPSLITPIGRLTGHLQSPDFFDVEQFPKATFKTTKIEATDAAAGKYKITGDLTIRDVKKSISFPTVVKVTDAGAVLMSKFKLKRSELGLTFGPDRIVEEVAMTITVGKPTPKVRQE